MGRVRSWRLSAVGVLLVGCGSAGVVDSADAGPDVLSADAGQDVLWGVGDAGSRGTCFTGAVLNQAAPLSTVWDVGAVLAVISNDSGTTATVTSAEAQLVMAFNLASLAPGVSNITTGEGRGSVEAACVACVCVPTFYPTTMTTDAGVLTYSEGVALLSTTGTVQAHAPCTDASAQATFWAVCQDAASTLAAQPTNVPFVVGAYSCKGGLQTVWDELGVTKTSGDSVQGTISITQTGAQVTVQYNASDPTQIPAGTLQLGVVSPNVAIGTVGQQVSLGCGLIGDNEDIFVVPEGGTMPVTAASLVVEGSTLVLSFTGTMGSNTGCDSATQVVVLVCQ